MLLRICLILTIVAGLATAYLGFFPVKDIITTTRDARDDFHTKLTAETALYQKTDKELRSTKSTLASTTAKLTETTAELEAANTKNTDLENQNTNLTDKLAKMTTRTETAEAKLEEWRQLPPPEKIKAMMVDLDQTKKTLSVVNGENKILLANWTDLDKRWKRVFGDTEPVVMTGLKGKIVAVDPKYDFVVLDVGEAEGAKERGELMVNRRGKFVGKVRITSVQKDSSVATIMPAWKRGQIMEGDQVLY